MISSQVPRFGSTDIAPLMNLTSHAAEAYRNKNHDEKPRHEILNNLQNQRPDLFTSSSSLSQGVLGKSYTPPVTVNRSSTSLRFGAPAAANNPVTFSSQNAFAQVRHNSRNAVRFGAEPLSMLWFSDPGSIGKVIGYLLRIIVTGPDTSSKKLAERHLRNANLSTEHNGKLQYLKEAEKEYLRHAQKVHDDHELAATYKNLAVIAKLNGRDQRVINDYVEDSMSHFNRWAEDVKMQGDIAVGTRSSSIGSGIPVSSSAEYRYDRERPKYEAEDIVEVCNKLHSSRYFTKPSIEPTASDDCIIL